MAANGDEQVAFGWLLRRRRLDAGLTQEELADRSGLSVRTIRDLERGATGRPFRSSVDRLARALDLTGADRDAFARAARGRSDGARGPARDQAPVPARDHAQGPARDQALGPAVPRQLPAAPADFVGRSAELRALDGLLHRDGGPAGTVVVSAIGGTAGVGKTALAVHWAHRAAGRFPDGQLYVNLRGYDPDRPMAAGDALAGFLRALGVPGADIPADTGERAARYRSLLADRRILVLLDNAGSAEQVRPLLPGSPSCTTVVTSRDSLSGLVARDGARRLDLDLLPPGDAGALLTALIGDRAAADPAATTALAGRCARLPLALRVAAELASARPAVPLARLVAELADQQRLDMLEAGGDPRTAVRAVFSWSYRQLGRTAARAFRLAGLHPGADIDAYAVAALAGSTLAEAGQALDQLARAHLIQATAPGRYGMHDLLRAYATERAATEDGEAEQRAALTRLFDHYLHTAATATDTLQPADRHRRLVVPRPATPAAAVTEPRAARAWLGAHRPALVAVVAHAAAHGWPDRATQLASTLFYYLAVSGHYTDVVAVNEWAHRAARRAGDRPAEARALQNLGWVSREQGRYEHAASLFGQSLDIYRACGNRTGEARTLNDLGLGDAEQGRYQQAARNFQSARTLFRQTGDRFGEARAVGNLGVVERRGGRYQQAAGYQRQALALCREIGDRTGEATALARLGMVEMWRGRYEQAAGYQRQALALCREIGVRPGEADALLGLGDVALRQGLHQEAAEHHRQGLALCREFGDRAQQAHALNGLGEALLATGRAAEAVRQYAAALDLTVAIGDKYRRANAHDGLGRALHALGDPGRARGHWQLALALYNELGCPEAGDVQARLADDGAAPPAVRAPSEPAGPSEQVEQPAGPGH